jgi:hypothetical protein
MFRTIWYVVVILIHVHLRVRQDKYSKTTMHWNRREYTYISYHHMLMSIYEVKLHITKGL